MESIIVSGLIVGSVVYLVYHMLNRHKKCGCGTCVCSGQFRR
jgi:hypothetical protein